MYRPTSRQSSLFEAQYVLPASKAERLKNSWAESFRTIVLPAIDEELFRDAFHQGNGRPNKSIQSLVALHLLKEWHDLTDQQVIEQFEFNLQWHYALEIAPADAHICQKTMHNFRVLLMQHDRAQQIFVDVTQALAASGGVSFGQQRLDSTHVISNIAQLTRLSLFVETIASFLRAVRREQPATLDGLEPAFIKRYLEREGYFSDATRAQAQRRLPVVAKDLYSLLKRFEDDAVIGEMDEFALLVRLFGDQCYLLDEPNEPSEGGSTGDGPKTAEGEPSDAQLARVQLRAPKTIASTSLQSPHDPDATYGRKGKGYEVQVSETCGDENPFELITATALNGAHESDQRALMPMLEQLDNGKMKPVEIMADMGYGSGENIVAAAEQDVELVAPVGGVASQDADDKGFEQPAVETPTPQPKTQTITKALLIASLAGFSLDSTCSTVLACPNGKTPRVQHIRGGRVYARFDAATCEDCPLAEACPTRELKDGDHTLRFGPAKAATRIRQVEQQQAPFKERYRIRSGVESTNAELKGKHGLADIRVRGRERVELVMVLKALALNVKRALQWHTMPVAAAA